MLLRYVSTPRIVHFDHVSFMPYNRQIIFSALLSSGCSLVVKSLKNCINSLFLSFLTTSSGLNLLFKRLWCSQSQ